MAAATAAATTAFMFSGDTPSAVAVAMAAVIAAVMSFPEDGGLGVGLGVGFGVGADTSLSVVSSFGFRCSHQTPHTHQYHRYLHDDSIHIPQPSSLHFFMHLSNSRALTHLNDFTVIEIFFARGDCLLYCAAASQSARQVLAWRM
jgi:hypothetical protein